jgi:hypothetical protein
MWEKSEMNKTSFQMHACENLHDPDLHPSGMLRNVDWYLPTFRDS